MHFRLYSKNEVDPKIFSRIHFRIDSKDSLRFDVLSDRFLWNSEYLSTSPIHILADEYFILYYSTLF